MKRRTRMAEKEYIERDIAINEVLMGDIDKDYPRMDIAARLHDIPAADVVTRGCYEIILWENDIMRQQLADIGKAFAEKMDDVRPVVRGKWIPVGTDDMDEGMFKCSECGSEHFFPEILLGIPADNYCPNCGADMREES
jgi:hypothetical protein